MPNPPQTDEMSGFRIASGTGIRYNKCCDLEPSCVLPIQGCQSDRGAMDASTKSGNTGESRKDEAHRQEGQDRNQLVRSQ